MPYDLTLAVFRMTPTGSSPLISQGTHCPVYNIRTNLIIISYNKQRPQRSFDALEALSQESFSVGDELDEQDELDEDDDEECGSPQ